MTALALLVTFIWVYLLFLRGGFWRVAVPAPVPLSESPIRARSGLVAVVIPARNEAADIGQTVRALLAQDYPGDLRIIVVDDHSSDGTREVALGAGAAADAGDRLTVIQARDLPPGWTGKLWAVSEGMAVATAMEPEFILMTDADITHGRDSISSLTARAKAEDLDLTSEMVRLRCVSWPERALIPAFVFFFFMLYPPRWVADPADRTAAAAGGCMLIRPAALARIGGIAAIRSALIDDCALAAAIKKSGGKIRLDVTRDTVSSRVYGTLAEIWSMIARTAYTQLHHSPPYLAGTLAGLFLTYLAPPLFFLYGHGMVRLLGLAAWAMMAVAFRPTLRLYDRSWVWGLALPAIALFYAAATFGSAINYWRGKGGQWKGRAQAGHGL
jgi:hopene-associated glycosyltransferase HpnB